MEIRASRSWMACVALSLPLARAQHPAAAEAELLQQGAASFDPALPAAVEVVRTGTGHLLVRPLVNGREAGWFIFDTGAGICVVSTPHVEELELEEAGGIDAVGVGGGHTAGLYRAAELSLGPMTLRDHPIMTTDLSFLEAHLGKEIVGVIGYGVLSRCVAEIDLAAPSIALRDPATYALTGAEWTPAELADRIPAVRVRFEDREGVFHLDTGANTSVGFFEPAVRKWKLLEGREVSDTKLGGVGGFVAAKRGVLAWLELGGVRLEKVEATFTVEGQGVGKDGNRDGNLGTEILGRFVLVTDYPHERIAFKPRAAAPAQER